MKIGKSQLKAIIKECLVELLAEGLGSNLTEAVVVKPQGSRNRDVEPVPGHRVAVRQPVDPFAGRRRALDETRVSHVPTPPAPIPANVSAITRDPVMAAIFADTAKTTLIEQQNGVRPGQDIAAQAAARVEPTQLFDEAQIDRWNEAAFKPARPGGLLGPSLPVDFLNDLLKGG